MRSRHASILLTPAAARAIHFWRALLILIRLQETRFARCIYTFSQQHARWLIEFDASLSGIGLIISYIDDEGAEVPVGGCAVDISRLGFGTDSSNQNTAEFIGVRHYGLGCTSPASQC